MIFTAKRSFLPLLHEVLPTGIKLWAIGALILILYSNKAIAKAIVYDTRDGLSNNSINTLLKDRNGLIWIGTLKGLNIFDGYTFSLAEGPLAKPRVFALAQPASGQTVMVGTDRGVFAVNARNFEARLLRAPAEPEAIWCTDKVSALCTLPGSNVLFALFAKNRIVRIDEKGRLSPVVQIDSTIHLREIHYRDADNLLLIGEKVYNLNLSRKSLSPLPALEKVSPLYGYSAEGRILFNSFAQGISLYELPSLRLKTPAVVIENNNRFDQASRAIVKNNKLYVFGKNYTFSIIDLQTQRIVEVAQKYPNIFEGKTCNAIWVDEHNVIWMATHRGLIKVAERPESFTRPLYNFPARVSTRKMLETASGDIYICSYSGLWQFRQTTQQWTVYSRPPLERPRTSSFPDPFTPLCILPDATGNYLYVGYTGDRLLRFDQQKKIFEAFDYKEQLNGGSFHSIGCMAADRHLLCLGPNSGLASFDTKTAVLTYHKGTAFDLGNRRVMFLYKSNRSHLLYAGTDNGLFVIDPNRGIIKRYDFDSRPALSCVEIIFIDEDAQGNVWLGTQGGGINILSANGKTIQKIRKQDGLSNDIVYAIIPADSNTLWISTFSGLARYRKDTRSFNNYFEEDGLASDEFNQNSFLKTRKGEILMGSINGITAFYPRQIAPLPTFRIIATGISKWDDKTQSLVMTRLLPDSQQVIIKRPSDQVMEVHLASTDYSDPGRNSFYYRIGGKQGSWVPLGDRHSINLASLPYGDYPIEVKAINPRGTLSDRTLVLYVDIVQPFYRTWWFYLSLLVLTGAFFYAAYLVKSRNFKSVLQLRMKIASNLHDEVGSLLTRITLVAVNLRHNKYTEIQKDNKLDRIVSLSRDAVTSMSDVLWAIDSRNDFAVNLWERMQEHADELLSPLNAEIYFLVSETDLSQPISPDARQELYLWYKEAIHNIVKHSKAKNVHIRYHIQKKAFHLKVTNDGVPQEPEPHISGQGLNNMRMRARRIGARLKIEQKDDTFTVEISKAE